MWVMIRLAGACCIMSGCMLAGLRLERNMKRRWLLLQEMCETLAFLEKEMTYRRSPVQEAFRCAAEKCTTELSRALDLAADQIEGRGGQAFPAIWEDALRRCLPRGLLTEEEFRALCGTAPALSNTDIVMQRTLLERYADRFREMSRREAAVCQEKGSLYRKLAAAAGLFLILILL